MDIYNILKKDHRAVEELLESIVELGSSDSSERDELFAQVREEVLVHSQAEQIVFYDELKKRAQMKSLVGEAEGEHEEIESLLEELGEGSALAGTAWAQRCLTLAKALRRHIEVEETEMFSLAKKLFNADEAKEMGAAMLIAKKEALADVAE